MATKTKTKGETVTAKSMVVDKASLFSDLDLPTLHTVADYFGVDQEESIQEQILSFAENGVTYALYAKAFEVPLPEGYSEDEDEPVVEDEEEPVSLTELVDEATGPVTAPRSAALAPQQEYLIKMTRANPYFEVASLVQKGKIYKFTQEHPYAIMDARTAQFVLEHETQFRQAFPDELREFYSD